MKLRTRFLIYLVALHILLGGVAVMVLVDHRLWLIAAEVMFVLSAVGGWVLVRSLFAPLQLISTGSDLLSEKDFSSQFRKTGAPEIDALITVFNGMVDQLREERLKAEEQHHFLEKIIAVSPTGFVACDYEGAIASVNPAAAAMFGMPARSLVGRTLREVNHPLAAALVDLDGDDASRVVAPLQRRRMRVHRGSFIDRGFPRNFYLIEELTEELRASEKTAYEKLIRMMSHEVNNSMGAIRSLIESSLNYADQVRPEDREDFRNALQVAASRGENLNRFTNGFADVVRIPPPARRPESMGALLRDIVTLLRPELEARRIRCRLEIDDTVGAVSIDKNQMEQVVINAMKNAIEAIGEDGEIVAKLSRSGRGSELTIRDSGSGLAEDVRPQLFTPFFSTKRDGRGLGLTIVQEILSQHGFDYSLEPAEPRGAEFRIAFS